jgi:hypothetical protein
MNNKKLVYIHTYKDKKNTKSQDLLIIIEQKRCEPKNRNKASNFQCDETFHP